MEELVWLFKSVDCLSFDVNDAHAVQETNRNI